MTIAIPLLFLLLYGYSYLLSSPERTITIGLMPAATSAAHLRQALSLGGFRFEAIKQGQMEEHLRDGDPPIIIDLEMETGEPVVYGAPYWRPVAELVLQVLDHAAEPSDDFVERLNIVEPGHAPFYLFPAILTLALLNIGLFAAGTKLLQERSRGTLRLLRMFPVSIGWYFSAEIATKLLIAFGIIVLYLVLAVIMFGLRLAPAQILAVSAVSLMISTVFISIGLALATVVNSYSIGIHVFTVCNLLMVFLGDLFFSASRFPVTKIIALSLPSTYSMDLMKETLFDSPRHFPLLVSVIVLFAWIVIPLAIAIQNFNYKAQE